MTMNLFQHRPIRLVREAWLHTVAMSRVDYKGNQLPPRQLRFCGREFRDDQYYFNSGMREVDRLIRECGLSEESSVLDVGCGPGRLAIALKQQFPRLRAYLGVDVHAPSIRWCKRFLEDSSTYRFLRLGMRNERYNPNASNRHPVGIPQAMCPRGSVNVINLFSVFSHLPMSDIQHYLSEFKSLLARDGAVFLTAFLRPDATDALVENPADSGKPWSGPLHCVQLDLHWFEDQVRQAGFEMSLGPLHAEVDGQTAVYLRHDSVSPVVEADGGQTA